MNDGQRLHKDLLICKFLDFFFGIEQKRKEQFFESGHRLNYKSLILQSKLEYVRHYCTHH